MYLLNRHKKPTLLRCIPNFLSDDEINHIFQFCEKNEFTSAKVSDKSENFEEKNDLNRHIKNTTTGYLPTIRESNIKWIDLNDDSNWIYDKLITIINDTNANYFFYILKYLEKLQFTHYDSNKNGFYGQHKDQPPRQNIETFLSVRKLSFSIQLSDPNTYKGGDLLLYSDKISMYTNKKEYIKVPKTKGTLIFFPSDVLHEVTPVTKGDRYSLVGWVNGPNLL